MSESRVPIEPGFFTIPRDPNEAPRLLGSRCRECDETFFPRRPICAQCLTEETEDVRLGPRGRLYTYTYTHLPLFNSRRAGGGGYGVGQIDLPEGPRVQAVNPDKPEGIQEKPCSQRCTSASRSDHGPILDVQCTVDSKCRPTDRALSEVAQVADVRWGPPSSMPKRYNVRMD